jgi:DNA-directed RNA polymerase specialized sigma24 family protein
VSLLAALPKTVLSHEERRTLTLAAKEGDAAAYETVLSDLAPNLLALARSFSDAIGDFEEAESVAIHGFAEALEAYRPQDDPDGVGVLAILSGNVRERLSEAAGSTHAVTVPARTLRRYFAILKRADGDVSAAAALAPALDLSEEAFWSIHGAVSGGGPLTEDTDTEEDPAQRAENAALARQALHALAPTPDLHAIATRAYGFHDYRAQTDAEIGGELGMTRPTVQRRRQAALGIMREAVGV